MLTFTADMMMQSLLLFVTTTTVPFMSQVDKNLTRTRTTDSTGSCLGHFCWKWKWFINRFEQVYIATLHTHWSMCQHEFIAPAFGKCQAFLLCSVSKSHIDFSLIKWDCRQREHTYLFVCWWPFLHYLNHHFIQTINQFVDDLLAIERGSLVLVLGWHFSSNGDELEQNTL